MNEIEKVISEMDFQYFGSGQHKIDVESFLNREDALLLDVRAEEEMETVRLQMKPYCDVLEIPTHNVPERLNEIPKEKFIGVFCSSGVRCAIIFAYLKSKGYDNVRILLNGYEGFMGAVKPGKIYKKING